jgi:hypothetical protein
MGCSGDPRLRAAEMKNILPETKGDVTTPAEGPELRPNCGSSWIDYRLDIPARTLQNMPLLSRDGRLRLGTGAFCFVSVGFTAPAWRRRWRMVEKT